MWEIVEERKELEAEWSRAAKAVVSAGGINRGILTDFNRQATIALERRRDHGDGPCRHAVDKQGARGMPGLEPMLPGHTRLAHEPHNNGFGEEDIIGRTGGQGRF